MPVKEEVYEIMISLNIQDMNLKNSWPDVIGKTQCFIIDFSTPS